MDRRSFLKLTGGALLPISNLFASEDPSAASSPPERDTAFDRFLAAYQQSRPKVSFEPLLLRKLSGITPQTASTDAERKSNFERLKSLLKEVPVEKRYSDVRVFAALDYAVIRDAENEFRETRRYFLHTYVQVLADLEQPVTAEGVQVFRLPNEGAIIRSKESCFGVDLVMPLDDLPVIRSLVEKLDALFITHEHPDHCDSSSRLLAEWAKTGKPLVYPKDRPGSMPSDVIESGQVTGMSWTCYKGWHWSNHGYSGFFRFEIAGKRIVHSGDNTRWLAFSELESAKNPDLFLFKPECLRGDDATGQTTLECWPEVAQRMQPKWVVPHHIIDVRHGLDAYNHHISQLTRDQTPWEIAILPLLEGESLWI